MESEGSAKDLVLTQISVGGFDNDVNAKMLSEYLEEQFGQVWRCRLKTSSTPPDSYPTYDIDVERVQRMNYYRKVEPHTFSHLHLQSPQSMPLLLLGGRRTIIPCKFTDVSVEIGVLVGKDDFVVGWRGPHTGVNFLVDPFNGTCKIFFTKNIVFSLNGETRHAIIKCNFKIEVLLRGIDEIKEYKDFTSLEILLQLASSPLVFYRTADDDIEESVAFDLLDNDDQWIRTTDITRSGAIEVSTHPEMAVEVRRRGKIRVPDIINWMGRFSDNNGANVLLGWDSAFIQHMQQWKSSYKSCREVAIKCQSSLCLSERYDGCKGAVACWPTKNDGIRLSLRPIILLSSLGVKDEKFWEMQKEMLSRLDKILVDPDVDFDNCKQLRSKLIQDCMSSPP
ncbi:hypothetical protein RND71_016265 [Anisodus tanguticus]|uniref:RNA-directed RNA polymerase n=1 Tax=Anisodus tanguticus TaxID=243964 RepID=A0AAE1S8K3_9SOLA|nr:hypothetical protein RND71_016265 [Anisodus tanguticus]